MELDERLKAVAAFALNSKSVADIGTDHAYLAVYLAEHGVEKLIAADKNLGPCEAARRTIETADLTDKIEVRQGDGLAVLRENEVETICIAGMGGALIADILAAKRAVLASTKRLVLQPMNAAPFLRRRLYELGFFIKSESLAKADGRLYEIICAERGEKPLPKNAILIVGECLLKEKGKYFAEHFENLLAERRRILENMGKSERARTSEKYVAVKTELEELEALKNA